jgi:signal recognition particle receptor subunit beta
MVFFNYATMQMAAKIVYYGPGLCGKTTNLHHIYTKTSPQSRGEMVSLETETDRTLFFDLLPIDVGVIGGFKTRLQLYTVPGQVFYNTTRKLVLKGVDGIVFVADSQNAMLDANADSLRNLRENLAEIGLDLDEIPLVIQLNKRDLPGTSSVDEMLAVMDPERKYEHVESVASTGVGVFETLKVISKLTLRTLRRRMTGEEPIRATPPARVAQFRIRDDAANPARTVAGTVPTPAAGHGQPLESVAVGGPAQQTMPPLIQEEVDELEAAAQLETAGSDSVADIDRHIIADAPIAEPPPFPDSPDMAGTAPAPAPEPEIDFNQTEKPQKTEPVKTVKVRTSVDVMAELEALRKRATASPPRTSKKDALAELANLRPKRDIHRAVNVQIPRDIVPRTRSVRVTLAFEDGDQGVIETRDERVELGDTSDVQSLSVNLKIDLA